MKSYYIILVILSLCVGCTSDIKPQLNDKNEFDKIKQFNFPTHVLKECKAQKKIIGIYEFREKDWNTDSIHITIRSGEIKLDEFTLAINEHYKRKVISFDDSKGHIPISYEIPPYSGIDTLNLVIDLNRSNGKKASNTCQIIYHEKRDTVDFILYDVPSKLIKYGFSKKFESTDVKLKKDYGYFFSFKTDHLITKTKDSINYTIQLNDVLMEDSETGEKTKFKERPKFSYNYPLHYDIQNTDYTYKSVPKGVVKVTHKTNISKVSYPGYNLYHKRIGNKIRAVLRDCDQIDTLYTEDVLVPHLLRPSFYSLKEVNTE